MEDLNESFKTANTSFDETEETLHSTTRNLSLSITQDQTLQPSQIERKCRLCPLENACNSRWDEDEMLTLVSLIIYCERNNIKGFQWFIASNYWIYFKPCHRTPQKLYSKYYYLLKKQRYTFDIESINIRLNNLGL